MQLGIPLPKFLQEADLARSTYRELPPEHKPRTVRVGGRVFVMESPPEWLARLAAAQARDARGTSGVPAALGALIERENT